MPHEAGAELRAQEGRPRAVSKARGKVIDGAHAELRAPEITIIVPEGGVAMMDGTSTTDAAIERKLVAAVKKHAALKVKLSYAEKARPRAQAIEALVRKAGAKDVEVTVGIVTYVPSQPPPSDPPPAPVLVLTVAANGTLTLGDRVVAERDLDKALATVAKNHPRLAIAPHGSTTAATVNKLLQRAKAAGFTDVIFLASK